MIAAYSRAGAHFSITTGMNPSVERAVLGIPDDAWQQISFPTTVPDPETGELISDAQVAELPEYTAFASRKKADRVTAHLTSGHLHANAAWLTLWAMTYNLLRAAGSDLRVPCQGHHRHPAGPPDPRPGPHRPPPGFTTEVAVDHWVLLGTDEAPGGGGASLSTTTPACATVCASSCPTR